MPVVWFFCYLSMILVAGELRDTSSRVMGYLSALCFFVAFASSLLADVM